MSRAFSRLAVASFLFAVGAAAPVRAQPLETVPPAAPAAEPARSAFWGRLVEPERQRANELVRQARLIVLRSQIEDRSHRAERRAHLRNALARLELARDMAPDDPDVRLELADVTSRLVQYEPDLADVALVRWRALREVAPYREAETVGFEVAVLHTRAQRYAEAAEEYERALRSQPTADAPGRSTILGNLAEVTMLSGAVERALHYYQRAHAVASGPIQFTLTLWGEAIALDRLGEHRSAVARATDAMQTELAMGALEEAGVFFEPAFELHWYKALGFEAMARLEPEEEIEWLRRAEESWRRFLDEGGRQTSPWAATATAQRQAVLDRLRE